MDTRQVRNLMRVGTWLAVGLTGLSVGLMLLGWTVPRSAAFEAGVFGFRLFPIAILAILARLTLPIVLNTSVGRAFFAPAIAVIVSVAAAFAWVWNRLVSSEITVTDHTNYAGEPLRTDHNAVLDHILYRENPEVGINPLEYIPEDPILRPNEYRPDYMEMFDEEGFDR